TKPCSRRLVMEEVSMADHSKRIKLDTIRGGRIFAEALHRTAIAVWAVSSLLLVGAGQARAATPVEVTGFGSNPGNLRMFKYIPDQLPASSPLVVVLHGCTQNGRDFAQQSGWIGLADRLRVALVMPEQTLANNPRSCFNWFVTSDNMRDRGEALS